MIVAALCIDGEYFIPGSHHENVVFPDMPEELASIEGRKAERVDKVREVAKHLGEDFFTPERASRWAGMEETAFAEYLADLGETAAKAGNATGQEIPRETAMEGTRAPAGDGGPSKTSKLLAMRRAPVRRSA